MVRVLAGNAGARTLETCLLARLRPQRARADAGRIKRPKRGLIWLATLASLNAARPIALANFFRNSPANPG
jgi:hypothetical protein